MKLRYLAALGLLTAFGCEEEPAVSDAGTFVDLAGAPIDLAIAHDAAPVTDAAPGAQTFNVAVGPNGTTTFAPMTVTIHPGDTVTWTWQSGPHTVTSGAPGAVDGKFCSLPEGSAENPTTCNSASYARVPPFTYSETDTFRTPGTYPYFCEVHGAAMTGSVVVVAR